MSESSRQKLYDQAFEMALAAMQMASNQGVTTPERQGPIYGDSPCSTQGCTAQNSAMCEYVDRRERRCGGAWCADHQVMCLGVCCCQRHAGTLRALGTLDPNLGFPDVDNRAPSLVDWVARDLDAIVSAILQDAATGAEDIARDPAVRSFRNVDRTWRWQRGWKLVDHTGSLNEVIVAVEDRSAEVVIRITGATVLSETPPWIANHVAGITVSPQEDLVQRREFYERIGDLVHQRIAQLRRHYN